MTCLPVCASLSSIKCRVDNTLAEHDAVVMMLPSIQVMGDVLLSRTDML